METRVVMREVKLFTYKNIVLEGPRTMVESAARTFEYLEPRAHRSYSMLDVTSGQWRVLLEVPY